MSRIEKVGVCGAAGTLGSGIAIVSARAGFETVAYDLSPEILDRARSDTERFFENSVARQKMEPADRDAALARLVPATKLEALADCDLVIEAVFEDLDVKQSLFRSLDSICSEEALLASNTSTLSITEIASVSGFRSTPKRR